MAERSNAAVLKTVDCQRSGGSNPSLSAPLKKLQSLIEAFLMYIELAMGNNYRPVFKKTAVWCIPVSILVVGQRIIQRHLVLFSWISLRNLAVVYIACFVFFIIFYALISLISLCFSLWGKEVAPTPAIQVEKKYSQKVKSVFQAYLFVSLLNMLLMGSGYIIGNKLKLLSLSSLKVFICIYIATLAILCLLTLLGVLIMRLILFLFHK